MDPQVRGEANNNLPPPRPRSLRVTPTFQDRCEVTGSARSAVQMLDGKHKNSVTEEGPVMFPRDTGCRGRGPVHNTNIGFPCHSVGAHVSTQFI